MKIKIIDGYMFINGVQVESISFKNGTAVQLPFAEQYFDFECSDTTITGNHNKTTIAKNYISPGSTIICKGNVRLGDG